MHLTNIILNLHTYIHSYLHTYIHTSLDTLKSKIRIIEVLLFFLTTLGLLRKITAWQLRNIDVH